MRSTYELFREGEIVATFDTFEAADREAKCTNRPWKIWAHEWRNFYSASQDYKGARIVAEGDGSWKCTHVLIMSEPTSSPIIVRRVRLSLMATPDGLLFTEGAWNRGAPPDFRNTGNGLTRGDGRTLEGAELTTKDL